jgi:hypothetical protein
MRSGWKSLGHVEDVLLSLNRIYGMLAALLVSANEQPTNARPTRIRQSRDVLELQVSACTNHSLS